MGDDLRPGAELVVRMDDLEAQLRLLLARGYTPIWFEDLKHADEIAKPVILTFDDGYRDNYTELFPLLRELRVKATLFVVPGYLENEHCLSPEMLREMLASGLISVQCHTWYHLDLDTLSYEDRFCFVRRCWYADSVSDIASMTGGSSHRISVRLFRTRKKLYQTLKEEGLLE